MKRNILLSILFYCLSIGLTYGQVKSNILDTKDLPENLTTDELYEYLEKNLSDDGWAQIVNEGKNTIINNSNKDYILYVQLNCLNDYPPSFHIEYTHNYREGDFAGIDFHSADYSDKTNFLVDGVDYKNPFRTSGKKQFDAFLKALKKGKKLTIKVQNRTIDFQLSNSYLLDLAVECSPPKSNRDEEYESNHDNYKIMGGEEVEILTDKATEFSDEAIDIAE